MDLDLSEENTMWMESEVINGLRLWHVFFLTMSVILSVVILLCCCFRFRIPRTKQQIDADYQRRKICKKFRKKLQCIENSEMDEMDLKKVALDKIQSEFQKETIKTSDHSSNDESEWNDKQAKKTGTKKKKQQRETSKKDKVPVIQTIYSGNSTKLQV